MHFQVKIFSKVILPNSQTPSYFQVECFERGIAVF